MTSERVLHSYLERISRGELKDPGVLIPLLQASTLFIPVPPSEGDASAESETSSFRVITLKEGAARYVPAFTSREFFQLWSEGSFESLALAAPDLALTLSSNLGIVLDKDSPHEVFLTPAHVKSLREAEESFDTMFPASEVFSAYDAADDAQDVASGEDTSIKNEQFESEQKAEIEHLESLDLDASETLLNIPGTTIADALREQEFHDERENIDVDEPEEADEDDTIEIDALQSDEADFKSQETPSVKREVPRNMGALQGELELILRTFEEVQEAYFQEVDYTDHAIVGLLSSGLETEKRFLLIDEIAELSRKYFGSVGAIEVYDDLDSISSSSWELFKALTPFYVKESQEPLFEEPDFSIEIERTNEGAKSAEQDAPDSDSSWSAVKKTGMKLFGAFRGNQKSDD